MSSGTFPFSAVVGLDEAKRALLLLAVEPRLRGVLIGGRPGLGKTTLARGFIDLLSAPDQAVPSVELPLNVTPDRLLGGVDFERTLKTGRPVASKGLLCSADGGVLYVDEINLLDPTTASLLSAVLDRQAVILERDGLSGDLPAEFVLVGTYDQQEGPVDSTIRDRVGVIVEIESEIRSEELAEVTLQRTRFDSDPQLFSDQQAFSTISLRSAIADARVLLPDVRISVSDVRRLSEAAVVLDVPGNRADVLSVCAARASAALEGRLRVSEQDLVSAIKYVLLPRAKTAPIRRDRAQEPAEPIEHSTESGPEPGTLDARDSSNGSSAEQLVLRAIDSSVDIDSIEQWTGSGSASRRRSRTADGATGRAYSMEVRWAGARRIAIASTIRAAASQHRLRTCVQASGKQNKLLLQIKPDDLRYKRFKRRSGPLFIFAVDASGSMAVNRMAQAKGAMLRLLARAYLHRDTVAMISFRRKEAQVLLEPTRSVELASRIVDAMPVGGATPLAAGLVKTLELSRLARLREARDVELLLFTDGRANVGITDSSIEDELRRIGSALAAERLRTTVIDTRPRFVPNQEAVGLAASLGAEYVYLPQADPESLELAIRREFRAQPGDDQ